MSTYRALKFVDDSEASRTSCIQGSDLAFYDGFLGWLSPCPSHHRVRRLCVFFFGVSLFLPRTRPIIIKLIVLAAATGTHEVIIKVNNIKTCEIRDTRGSSEKFPECRCILIGVASFLFNDTRVTLPSGLVGDT